MTPQHHRSSEVTGVELLPPQDGGWYRTQIPDWVALHPAMTHTAYRLFGIIHALILDEGTPVCQLSYDQLAYLLPGIAGKPCGMTAVKDALAVLEKLGLVTNPDGARIVSSTGRGGVTTHRRYQLHDWPTFKEQYTGWRNAAEKLDAYTPNWRTTRTGATQHQEDPSSCGNQQRMEGPIHSAAKVQPSEAPSRGYLYAIGSHPSGWVKIGYSADPERRLRILRTSSPVLLKLLWQAPGSIALEQRLHRHFHMRRGHGEWFDFAGRDAAALIESAMTGWEASE